MTEQAGVKQPDLPPASTGPGLHAPGLVSSEVRLARNSLVMVAQVGGAILMGLVVPPVFIAHLGMQEYGVWAMMLIVNAAIGLLDFGLAGASVKYVSENLAAGDESGAGEILIFLTTVYSATALAGTVLVLAFPGALPVAVLSSVEDPRRYGPIFQAYAVANLWTLPLLPLVVYVRGCQRYDLVALVEMGATLASAATMLVGVAAGMGLWAVVAGSAAAWAVRAAGLGIVGRGGIRLLRRPPDRRPGRIRALFTLSSAEQLGKVYGIVSTAVMRISIERLAGVEFAGYYDVGKRVVAQVAGLSNILFVPLLPYVASHGARGEEARIRETLAMVYRLMLAGGIPTACFLFWFASPIFAAWIGPGDVSYPVLVCRVAMVYVCIELLTGPATTTAVGMGEPRISAAKLLLSIGLYAGVPVVGLLGGFEAMVLGEAAAVIAGSALSLALFQRQFGMGPGWIETRNAAAVLGLCAAVWAPVAILLLRYPLWWGWKSLATWGVSCLVGVCLTIVGSWVAGVLRSSEIRLVLGAVGFRG